MEERNNSALELSTAAGVHGGGAERLPDDALALVGRDEERDAGAETVALGEELVEADDDDASAEQLDDDQDRVTRAELADVTIDAGHNIGHGLTDGDEHAEKLLSAVTYRGKEGEEACCQRLSRSSKKRDLPKGHTPRPGIAPEFSLGGLSDPGGARATLGACDDKRTRADAD